MIFISNILIMLLTIVPSSSAITLKIFFILASMLLLLVIFAKDTQVPKQYVFMIVSIIAFLYFYASISTFYGTTPSYVIFRAGANIFICVYLTVFFLIMCHRDEQKETKRLLNTIYVCLSIYTLTKLFLLSLVMTKIASPKATLELIRHFAPNAVGQNFSSNLDFIRLQSGNDIVVLFYFMLLPVVQTKYKISKLCRKMFYFPSLISLTLTLTRYIWICLFFYFVASILTDFQRNKKSKTKFRVKALLAIFFSTLFLGSIFFRTQFANFFQTRISDHLSTNNKLEQTRVLLTNGYEKLFLGHGLGGFIPSYIRNNDLPFLYENQIMSLFYQFGIFGVITLLLFLLLFFGHTILPFFYHKNPNKLYVSFCLWLFLSSGLLNPYLFAINASLVYFLIKILSFNPKPEHTIRLTSEVIRQ